MQSFRYATSNSIYSESDDAASLLLGSDSTLDLDTAINSFVKSYRKLPLTTRAKCERWDINPRDLLVHEKTTESKKQTATYYGVTVEVTSHKTPSVIHPSSRIFTEIVVMAQLRHPNVVSFIGTSCCSTKCFVVTEYMPKGSLKAFYLNKQASRPSWRPKEQRALSWSLDLARAVNYLHQSDPCIIHRDLRPETIFVATSGAIKVGGFGKCIMAPDISFECNKDANSKDENHSYIFKIPRKLIR